MARVTKEDLKPTTPHKDSWDQVLEGYKKDNKMRDKKNVSLSEKETKDHVISFRVTDSQYEKLMGRFGDPNGIREVLLPEMAQGLEEIEIQETGDILELK